MRDKSSKLEQKQNRRGVPPFLLGIHRLISNVTSLVPRMEWMPVMILDTLEHNAEFLHDPLAHLSPKARETLLKLPQIAWVTIALFVINLSVMSSIVVLCEFEIIRSLTAFVLMTIAMFAMFTVAHDAAHGSISSIKLVNGVVGRIAGATLGPIVCFPSFRYIHNMHHKFTNDPTRDPDRFCVHGAWYTIPIRCLFVLPHYTVFYLKAVHTRPKWEILEFILYCGGCIGFLMSCYDNGLMSRVLLYWILPSTLAQSILAFFFDYIPHHHSTSTPIESRYHTTSILKTYSFLQPVVSLLLQYQDYHLIHHLYPTIPFYRYADKWHEKQDFLLEKQILINNVTIETLKPQIDAITQTIKEKIA